MLAIAHLVRTGDTLWGFNMHIFGTRSLQLGTCACQCSPHLHACCCAVQVPLQLGAAFTAAAQQDLQSPATMQAMYALNTLLGKATAAEAAGIASNPASIQRQLRQSGMLQQLSAFLAAMAAELEAETAALAAGGWDAASGDVEQWTAPDALHSRVYAVLGVSSLLWQFWQAHKSPDGWMWGPSGHGVAVMQFATAVLQHVSSIAQHVLPAARERSPQLADALEQSLQNSSQMAGLLCTKITNLVCFEKQQSQLSPQQQGQGIDVGTWQPLLRSPHLLPCVATVAVMAAFHLGGSVMTHCERVEGSTGGRESGSRSSRGLGSSSSSSTPPLEQQQQQPGRDGSSSSSSRGDSGVVTACQLQLLGLTPEVTDWAMQLYSKDDAAVFSKQTQIALDACTDCCEASERLLQSNSIEPRASDEQQQRWQFELRLWQALPLVLLPCASSLLLPGVPPLAQAHGKGLLELSEKAVSNAAQLRLHLQTLGIPPAPPPAPWGEELLSALLQLADRLLYQQPSAPAVAEAAANPAGPTGSSTSTSTSTSLQEMRSSCTGRLLLLLLVVVRDSQALFSGPSIDGNNNSNSDSNSDSCSSAAGAPCGSGTAAVLQLSAKFVEFVTSLDATVRASSKAIHIGTISTGLFVKLSTIISCLCSVVLLPRDEHVDSALMQHMALRGPVALSQEQQQLYSLLSTLQKLRCCVRAEGQWDFGVHMADSCCLAAGHVAVGLLTMALAAARVGSAAHQHSQPSVAAATVAQQPAVSYLPSLVIFGRCLLQWAEQLQQQGPELLVLGSAELQWNLYGHAAARVCLPGMRQGLSGIMPGERLESLLATVREWVGVIDLPASAQLTAAGCTPQQLQQQLDALLSAQNATQQGLTDASLAALVQQLQATGAMLGSIAVPHFCNNAACTNLSGPTEVLLVSGRSCICAGCRIARYCGRACQRAAWKQHKPVCQALAAAAASTAATVGE